MAPTRNNAGQPTRKHRRAAAVSDKRRGAGRRVIETQDLPELCRARGLWQRRQFQAALDLFEQTAQNNPRNLMALTDAARAFGSRYEIEKADTYLSRMLELAPNDSGVYLLAGQSYRMIFRPDQAITCLKRAVELDPELPEARLELALLQERRGHLDEAEEHVRALVKSPGCPAEVRVIEGRLARRQGEHARAATLLSSVLKDADAVWLTRQHAGMELSRTRDAEGDYDSAFTAASSAKAIARESAASLVPDGDIWVRSQWEKASHGVSKAQIQRWSKQLEGEPLARLALLTGPPRSGTTLLENVLDTHPELISSDERGAFPRYISSALMQSGGNHKSALDNLDSQVPSVLKEYRQQYLAFMQSALGEPIGGRLHLDKNPSISTLIPGVLRLFPECKILLALRDPRDVVLSCYLTHMPINPQSVPYLDLVSAAEHYHNTMQAWFAMREQLEPEQYLEVKYEDVVADTEGQARRVLAFLELPWDDSVLRFQEHVARKQVDSPTYEQVAKPIYTSSIGRWKRYERHLRPALALLQPWVEALGYE